MAIYTKKGDKGTTGLLGGTRVEKDSLKVSCYGTLDEGNATLGVAYSHTTNEDIRKIIRTIQKKLFAVGAELASDDKGKEFLTEKIETIDIAFLEETVDHYEEKLGPIHAFIIPGDTTGSASLHQARSIIRRAERNIVKLDKTESVRDEIKKYVNRLSDTIFMLARAEANDHLVEEVKEKVLQIMNHSKEGHSPYLSLDTSKKMAELAERTAKKLDVPITFSVVDEHGNMILLHRMEGSLLASVDISQNKAFSAVALKMPTHEIAKNAQPGADLYGISHTNQNRIVTFGGGYPIQLDNRVIGAIGISGGTVEEDMAIAEKIVKNFNVLVGELK